MITTIAAIAVIAAVLVPLIRQDLVRACVRRADRTPPLRFTIVADVRPFIEAMDRAARAMAAVTKTGTHIDEQVRRLKAAAIEAGAISPDRVREALGLDDPPPE